MSGPRRCRSQKALHCSGRCKTVVGSKSSQFPVLSSQSAFRLMLVLLRTEIWELRTEVRRPLMTSAVRTPAVAGKFYPRRPEELRRAVQEYTSTEETGGIAALGCIAPHAGYMYSGHVAGAVYSRLEIPNRVIILCPNHTGMGHPFAVMTRTAWQTPLGDVESDSELGTALLQRFPSLREDSAAHRSEHAIEVQLPFLQTLRPDLTFVPIALGTSDF